VILGRVVGTVVATRKDERLLSAKLLVVRPVSPEGQLEGTPLVAVDTVDAGTGEMVLVEREFPPCTWPVSSAPSSARTRTRA
jgi:microcompartment protein CcmK/EutM